MNTDNLIIWLVVGLIAGWLATWIIRPPSRQGIVGNIIVGVIGGFIGGYVLDLLNVGGDVTGINVPSILTALVGAIILLWGLRQLRR